MLSRKIAFFVTFLDRLEDKLDAISGYPNLAWLRWDDKRFQEQISKILQKADQQHLRGFLSCVFHSFAMEGAVSSS